MMNSALTATRAISWTDIEAGLPNLFITDIVVNPGNSLEIYVTLSGYDEGMKVYKVEMQVPPGRI